MGVRENFAGGHFHNFHWLEEGGGGGWWSFLDKGAIHGGHFNKIHESSI